jgi:hypothetical protein
MTIVRRNLLTVTFSIWFIGLLVLDIVMVGRPNSNVVLLVVPLAFLAASALAELWAGLKQYGTWQNEGLILVAGLAITGFGYIGLTGWIFRTCGSDDLFCQYAWLQAVAALALFLIIAIAFWYMSGGGVTIRGIALTGVAIGLLITINTGWRLNYGPLMHLAYQPLAGTPPSTGLVMLSDILARQSAERVGDETLLDVTLAGVNSPALQWQLHKYRHLQEETNIDAPTTAIITPAETELSLNQPYLGQDFAVNAHWSPVGLPPKALLKWLIYRRADTQPNGEEVILWLRATDN